MIPKRYVVIQAYDRAPSEKETERVNPPNDDHRPNAEDNSHTDGSPVHVLVVEDSMIIALDVEEDLRRMGVKLIDVASNISGALSAIETREPNLAIVDFNLGRESSTPVIEELKRRDALFVVATGYAEMSETINEIGAMGIVRKPYGQREIEDVLKAYNAVIDSAKTLARKKILL